MGQQAASIAASARANNRPNYENKEPRCSPRRHKKAPDPARAAIQGRSLDAVSLSLEYEFRTVRGDSQQMLIAPLRGAGHALLFIWAAAFGIKCAIRSGDTFEALSSFCYGPSDGEVIGLAFDYERVSTSWKYKICILRPNY